MPTEWTVAAQAAQAAIDSGWHGYEPQPTTRPIESVVGLQMAQRLTRLFDLAGRGGLLLPALEDGESSLAVYTATAVYLVWQNAIWRVSIS